MTMVVRPTIPERLTAVSAVACGVACAGVLGISRWAWGDADAIDRAVLIAVRRHAEQSGGAWAVLKRIMLFATAAGSFPVLALLTLAAAALLWRVGRRAEGGRLLVAAGVGMAAANLVKLVIGRARPEVVTHWVAVSSLSFPSGHASDSSIAYLLLASQSAGAVTSRRTRLALTAAAVTLVVLVGVSRVYLGVHWPSDVLAGWAFGSAWALAAIRFVRVRRRRAVPPDGFQPPPS